MCHPPTQPPSTAPRRRSPSRSQSATLRWDVSGQAPPPHPIGPPRDPIRIPGVTVTQVLAYGSYLTALTVDTCATVTVMRRVPVQEAAQEVGVSRQTVHRYIRLGYLKAYRAPGVDRRTYVDVDELRELRRNPPFTELDRRDR